MSLTDNTDKINRLIGAISNLPSITAGEGIEIENGEISLDADALFALNSVGWKQSVPAKVAFGTNITLADNTEYRLSNVSSLILSFPQGDFECWMRIETAQSGSVSVVFPQNTAFIGEPPVFGNTEPWEISPKDRVVAAAEVSL